MPETSHVFRVYNFAATLWLQLTLCVILSPVIMFCTFTLAHTEVRVQCTIWLYSVAP
jgi:hypothetical protein